MYKEALFHEPDSSYCYPVSKNIITLRLRTSKKDNFDSINVIFGEKYTYHQKQEKINTKLRYTDDLYNYYEVDINLTDVRFVYVFEIIENNNIYYYCEDGLVSDYDFKTAYFNCFQYPYINEVDLVKKIDWLKDSVCYEIFVERFFQGDTLKDTSYINTKWNELPKPNSFYGGDLEGIIEKLDYLQDLGINLLYLTPIFSSISNHKYDINNYFMIDKQFGTNETFKRLVKLAHEKGIRIILDAVFNHTSNLLKEFEDAKEKGRASKYFDWFIIHGDEIDEKKVNYETFSNCYYHPKFNTSNEEVCNYLINIGEYYIKEYDIDGWRLDVADELSHDFWRKFRKKIKNIKPDAYLVGENWHNSYPFLRGDEFDGIMNYAFTKTLLDFLAFNRKDAFETSNKLNTLLIRNKDMINDMMLNLLDTHDTDRFYTSCNKDIDSLMCALSIQFIFRGIPGLYYGIEIPLEGGYDPDNRRTFPWDKLDTTSYYFNFLKELIKIRRTNEVLHNTNIKIYSENDLLIIKRFNEEKEITLYINNSNKDINLINNDKVLLSHNYQNNILMNKGLLIKEE